MPEAFHVPREKERLLQGLGEDVDMTPLRLPKCGIPRDGKTLHLQPKSLGVLTSVQLSLIPTLHGLGSFVLGLPSLSLFLGPFLRPNLPFLQIFNCPFLFQIWIGLQSEVGRELGRKIGRNLGLGGLLGG